MLGQFLESAQREFSTDAPKVRDSVEAKRHGNSNVFLVANGNDQATLPHKLRGFVVVGTRLQPEQAPVWRRA